MYDTLYLLPTVSPLRPNDIEGAQQLGCNARFLAWIWSPRKASLDKGLKSPDPTDSFPLRKALLGRLSLGVDGSTARPREWVLPLLSEGGLALPLLDVTMGIRILGLLGQTAEETKGSR